MKLENAIEFLMYSYFNLSLEDGNEPKRVLEASIERAYSDAAGQGAYNTQISKGDKEDLSKDARQRGYAEIESAIQELLKKDLKFEKWHEDICKKLCDEVYIKVCQAYNKDTFSYGNAQKWVNMSLKYLCILYEIYKEHRPDCKFCEEYGAKIEKYEKDFHVPIDSYIIKATYNINKKNKVIELPLREEKDKKYYGIDKYVPWSKWNEEQYKTFQKTLHESKVIEDSSPLDWENKAWIEVAKTRKEK